MSAAAPRMAPGVPFGPLAPVIRPIVAQLLSGSAWKPEYPVRVLEVGSSGGLVSALIRETPLVLRSIDFVDPAPATMEVAVERARDWPTPARFVNNYWAALAGNGVYDLILSWDLETSSRLAPSVIERLVHTHQKRPGLWMSFHETAERPFSMFGAPEHQSSGRVIYRAETGRMAYSAAAWVLR